MHRCFGYGENRFLGMKQQLLLPLILHLLSYAEYSEIRFVVSTKITQLLNKLGKINDVCNTFTSKAAPDFAKFIIDESLVHKFVQYLDNQGTIDNETTTDQTSSTSNTVACTPLFMNSVSSSLAADVTRVLNFAPPMPATNNDNNSNSYNSNTNTNDNTNTNTFNSSSNNNNNGNNNNNSAETNIMDSFCSFLKQLQQASSTAATNIKRWLADGLEHNQLQQIIDTKGDVILHPKKPANPIKVPVFPTLDNVKQAFSASKQKKDTLLALDNDDCKLFIIMNNYNLFSSFTRKHKNNIQRNINKQSKQSQSNKLKASKDFAKYI